MSRITVGEVENRTTARIKSILDLSCNVEFERLKAHLATVAGMSANDAKRVLEAAQGDATKAAAQAHDGKVNADHYIPGLPKTTHMSPAERGRADAEAMVRYGLMEDRQGIKDRDAARMKMIRESGVTLA
jgi:hypothetical protein